jgi:hypothetical protein
MTFVFKENNLFRGLQNDLSIGISALMEPWIMAKRIPPDILQT